MNAILLLEYFIKICTDAYCSLPFLYILSKLCFDNFQLSEDADDDDVDDGASNRCAYHCTIKEGWIANICSSYSSLPNIQSSCHYAESVNHSH